MSADATTEMWLRLMSGKALTAGEKDELLQALRKDEALRLRLLRDAELDGILRTLGWVRRDAEAFTREFSDCLSVEHDGARFVRGVEEEIANSTPRARRSRAGAWGWAAAGLLICLAAVWKLSGGEPGRTQTEEPVIGAPRLERTEGEVFLLTQGGKETIEAGHELRKGQRLEVGPGSVGVVVFRDQTRLEVRADSLAGEILEACRTDGHGKCVSVFRGTLVAEATPQPADLPMICRTPHCEAKVLGTRFRIMVDLDPGKPSTRLEVAEGKVELKRKRDGMVVEVPGGFYAVVSAGTELEAKPIGR